MDYEFQALHSDELDADLHDAADEEDGGAGGVAGGGAAVKKKGKKGKRRLGGIGGASGDGESPKAKDLYDAFGESDEDDGLFSEDDVDEGSEKGGYRDKESDSEGSGGRR